MENCVVCNDDTDGRWCDGNAETLCNDCFHVSFWYCDLCRCWYNKLDKCYCKGER